MHKYYAHFSQKNVLHKKKLVCGIAVLVWITSKIMQMNRKVLLYYGKRSGLIECWLITVLDLATMTLLLNLLRIQKLR